MEILLAIALGFGGGWYINEPAPVDCKSDPLITVACPPLTRFDDPTFGAHVIRLQEIASQYRACRIACMK